MARVIEITEDERRLLTRLIGDEWKRLDEIRGGRYIDPDPVLTQQQEVEELAGKLR